MLTQSLFENASINLFVNYGICWGFFVVDDGLLVDSVKPQMLQCIICKSEQASNDVLAQIFAICKHLIKYNNVIGILL
jgi:hypothetical protein